MTSIEQIWQRIATSDRALTGIKDLRQAGVEMKLFLLPWNERIRPEHEYRGFCAPNGGKVTAVSQYRWFQPWVHLGESTTETETKAASVLEGVLDIHQRLMRHPAVSELKLKDTGFTFDVAEVDKRIVLVELNDFGATTGCRSCLYHWLDDAKLLYGRSSNTAARSSVDFRVLGTP